VILARNSISKNCEEIIYNDYITHDIVILVLNEADLVSMIDRTEQGREAADILGEKYYEFIKQA